MLIVTVKSNKKVERDSGFKYKYLVTNEFGQGENAFRTKKGFVCWLRKCNLKIDFSDRKWRWIIKGQRSFTIIGLIEEKYACHKLDIPQDVKPIAWLSNGSWRICYAQIKEAGCRIYVPDYSEIKTLPYIWN